MPTTPSILHEDQSVEHQQSCYPLCHGDCKYSQQRTTSLVETTQPKTPYEQDRQRFFEFLKLQSVRLQCETLAVLSVDKTHYLIRRPESHHIASVSVARAHSSPRATALWAVEAVKYPVADFMCRIWLDNEV